MKHRVHAIVVAGGLGVRFGAEKPKQFLEILGKPVLYWSVAAFFEFPAVDSITIVSHLDWIATSREILGYFKPGAKVLECVPGGRERQESARLGIESLNADENDIVLIHDAARPVIAQQLIDQVIISARSVGAAIPVIRNTDSLIHHESGLVIDYLDRNLTAQVQTPQGFRFRIIQHAHLCALENNIRNACDDGSLVLAAGYPVAAVSGELSNIKMTTRADLPIIQSHIQSKFPQI
jgi:2-C-methyl-D-erythritol 4-phosphate cytidylyltransferase